MIGNCKIMGVLNLTPDSFHSPSRVSAADVVSEMERLTRLGADIIDLGAVSSRPGAEAVDAEEEWKRLKPALEAIRDSGMSFNISIDTTRSEIVRMAYGEIGPFIVNDISAGTDDAGMLPAVGALGLEYVAMHRRGTPETMDGLCDYPQGVIPALLEYFREFGRKAASNGISRWILDPGLGFAKNTAQCLEILHGIPQLKTLGVPVLIGAADKRFTLALGPTREQGTREAHRLALGGGADILRVHDPGKLPQDF